MLGKRGLSELRAAAYLYAIEQCDGKREAARKMRVSVDTLNKYIEFLEEDCGTELLCTTGSDIQLTARGKKITSYMSKIERVLQHMYEVVSERDKLNGDIRLLWNLSIRSIIISSELWNFLKCHSNCTIYSMSVDAGADINKFDCNIALVQQIPQKGDWEVVYSKKIRFGFFATSYYLKKHGYPLNVQDMLKNHYMIFKKGTEIWLENGKEIVANAQHKVYVSDTSFMVKESVENDVGIGLLPLSFVRYGLVCLDNIPCNTKTNAYILVRKSQVNDKQINLFCEYLKEIIKPA